MSSTPTVLQALPIKYGRGDLLQTELQKILGDGNFVVEGFLSRQWRIKVTRKLTSDEIDKISSNIRVHYFTGR